MAQLEYFAKEFDALIDKAASEGAQIPTRRASEALRNLKQLHGNAVGLVDPIVRNAVENER